MSSVNGNLWIWKYEKKLDSDFCRDVIRKFDRDFNLYHGVTLGDEETIREKNIHGSTHLQSSCMEKRRCNIWGTSPRRS